MEKNETNGGGGLLLPSFLAGLGAGVAAALLFAPRSGAATRSILSHKVKDGQDWIQDTAATAEENIRSHAAQLRDRAKAVAEAVTQS